MRVTVLFFGMLRDVAGCAEAPLDLAEGALLGQVFDHYAARFPGLAAMAASIVLARNQEFAHRSTPLSEGDEIALLPPVSGGSTAASSNELLSSGNYFAITRAPIDPRRLAARIVTGNEGAVVTFEGTVRNHTRERRTLCLDYEGYEPMALTVMAALGTEILTEFGIQHIALVHRLGRLLIGETSVAVIVTAEHRRPAFAAALEALNRLKQRVPIWKKEHFCDGEVWVEGEWDHGVPKASA